MCLIKENICKKNRNVPDCFKNPYNFKVNEIITLFFLLSFVFAKRTMEEMNLIKKKKKSQRTK